MDEVADVDIGKIISRHSVKIEISLEGKKNGVRRDRKLKFIYALSRDVGGQILICIYGKYRARRRMDESEARQRMIWTKTVKNSKKSRFAPKPSTQNHRPSGRCRSFIK